MKKIYVIDLDHTLCETSRDHDGNWLYYNAIPLHKRIEFINRLWEEGNTIIIETARGSSSKINHYAETFDQLRSWGLKFHHLRTGVKFAADYYIDDKAVNADVFFDTQKSSTI